ncbi:MAG: hypothetical protein DMG00_18805 [Acidobacteria bacterium]|nr:MAG: hypothetical protein DMG00_18805 [Acidobacteriota bacterium]
MLNRHSRTSFDARAAARASHKGGLMAESDQVKTGVVGLDAILGGGIPRGNVIVVEGPAGSGKTTLGLEFIYRGATDFGEPGLIVLFEVSPIKVIRDAAQFGWDLSELERQGKVKVIFTTRSVLQEELQQADSLLLAEAARIGARRMFIDSLPPLPFDGLNGHNGNNGGTREVFHTLVQGLHRENLTAMLAVESPGLERVRHATPPVEEFIADTLIVVRIEDVQRAASRSIEIVKSRGHHFQMGSHSFRIVDGRGLEVYKRVQAPRSMSREMAAAYDPTTRVPTGVPGLDELVNGGYFLGSTTLMVGVSGVGKSVMALQFIAEGQPHVEPGRDAGADHAQRPHDRDRSRTGYRARGREGPVRFAPGDRDRSALRPDRAGRRGIQAQACRHRQLVHVRIDARIVEANLSRFLPRARGAHERAPDCGGLQSREP